MSFAARSFQALGYSVLPGSAVINDFRLTPAVTHGSMKVWPDGTLSYIGNGSTGPARWHSDPGTPGNAVWMKWTDTTGKAATDGSVAGTVYALSAARTIGWQSAGAYIATGSGTLNFYADSGATILLGSISLSIDVESS